MSLIAQADLVAISVKPPQFDYNGGTIPQGTDVVISLCRGRARTASRGAHTSRSLQRYWSCSQPVGRVSIYPKVVDSLSKALGSSFILPTSDGPDSAFLMGCASTISIRPLRDLYQVNAEWWIHGTDSRGTQESITSIGEHSAIQPDMAREPS